MILMFKCATQQGHNNSNKAGNINTTMASYYATLYLFIYVIICFLGSPAVCCYATSVASHIYTAYPQEACCLPRISLK